MGGGITAKYPSSHLFSDTKGLLSMQSRRLLKDKLASKFMLVLTIFSGLIVFLIALGLYQRSRPILAIKPLTELLFSTSWHPLRGEFGFFPFIMGTLWVTGVAVAIAIPLCLLTAIYLSEYAHKRVREWTKPLIDLLAGIPSIVYGAFGFTIMLFFGLRASLLGGIIAVSLLILPIMSRAMDEVIRMVPEELLEASYALGATRLETAFKIVVRQALPGILTAVLIAFGRGIGDAASVIFTAGFTDYIPYSLFRPAATLPLAIFYQLGTPFPEVQQRAYASALILTVIILIVSIVARILTRRFTKHIVK